MDLNPKKWLKAIIGGYFVLSREAAFANADTIHIDSLKECNYQTVTLNKAYRYMKYVPPIKTEGNMAEIELYDEKDGSWPVRLLVIIDRKEWMLWKQ